MSNDEFARRAREGSGPTARKRNETKRCWDKIATSLALGSSLKSIHRELRGDGNNVGCFTHFRNTVRMMQKEAPTSVGASSSSNPATAPAASKKLPEPFMGDGRFDGY